MIGNEWPTEWTDLGDARVALFDLRRRGDPTVIFLHGIGCSKAIWTPVVRRLPDDWRVISCDLRGGGQSEESSPGKLSLSLWSSDLRAVLTTRGVSGAPIIVGHSLGASIALQFALDYPTVPAALVLIGAEASLCRLGPLMQERASAIVAGGIDAWVKGPWRQAPPFSAASRERLPSVLDEYATMLYLTGAERYLRCAEAIAQSPDLSEELGGIELPALVLIGGADDRTLPERGWDLAERLPYGRGIELPRIGHTLPMEAPERVAGEITDFVGSLPGAAFQATIKPNKDLPK
jgi:pimeloyl-ACP methyl ester carboxylesterase